MTEQPVTFQLELDEEETKLVLAALMELATRYKHLQEVCEMADHQEYANQYSERLDQLYDLMSTLREDEDVIPLGKEATGEDQPAS